MLLPVRRCAFGGAQAARPCGHPAARVNVRAQKPGPDATPPLEIAMLATVMTVSATPAAYADVDGAVNTTVEGVKALGEALKSGYSAAEGAASFAGDTYSKYSPQVNEFVDRARPAVKGTFEELNKVASPAAKEFRDKALPQVTESTRGFLRSSGVDVDALSRNAGDAGKQVEDAASVASPTVNKVVSFLTSADPATLGKTALGIIALYYAAPFAFKYITSSVRGYSGDISPARTVDLVATDGNAAVIDIRSMREKAAVGVPDVPSSARGRFIELEMAEIDRRLRGQLRNVDQVEAQVTALEIQALKRINRSSSILLLDKNGGGPSKNVAKELAKLGFSNVFIVSNGFSGWASSKLQVRQSSGAKGGGKGSTFSDILGTINVR